jgi:DinB superfamily
VKLAESQSAFLRAADAIPSEQWTLKPNPEEWSAAELVAHLIIIERAILGSADRTTGKTPRPIRIWERAHLPMWLAEIRLIRLKTPIPLDLTMIGSKEEMLGALRLTRERVLAFLAETQNRNLSVYRWRHPFLGSLNAYEWFEMIAAHQVRHTKQMKELGRRLLKVVEISQN